MEIKFTENDLKELLKEYFFRKDNIESDISINKKVGYDRYDQEECYIEVELKRKITILGREKIVSTKIYEEEIKNIFTEILIEEGYEVANLYFETGLKEEITGYGPAERTESRPYFEGLTVKLKENVKVKK